MGTFFWFYQRLADGRFERVPGRVYEPFFRGMARLPADPDRRVRLAWVSGRTDERHPVEVHSVDFLLFQVDANGVHTEQMQHEAMREAMESLSAATSSIDGPQLVDARARFQRRRYDARQRWKPSKQDVASLAALVNKRAGRRLL